MYWAAALLLSEPDVRSWRSTICVFPLKHDATTTKTQEEKKMLVSFRLLFICMSINLFPISMACFDWCCRLSIKLLACHVIGLVGTNANTFRIVLPSFDGCNWLPNCQFNRNQYPQKIRKDKSRTVCIEASVWNNLFMFGLFICLFIGTGCRCSWIILDFLCKERKRRKTLCLGD